MPETRCETVSELDSLHDVHSPYLDSNWRGEYKNDLPTSFTAVAVADRQVSMPKQGRGGVRGLSASQKGGRGSKPRPEADSNRTRGESAGDLDPTRTAVLGRPGRSCAQWDRAVRKCPIAPL